MRRGCALLGLVLWLGACDRSAPEIREWSPADHDQQEAPGAAAPEAPAEEPQPAVAGSSPAGDVLASMQTWSQLCAGCHGRFGNGDGPDGEGLGVPDFGSVQGQSRASDARMAQSVRSGRGKMPAFPFSDAVIEGLVQLVRRMGPAPAGSAAAGSAAPASSAP